MLTKTLLWKCIGKILIMLIAINLYTVSTHASQEPFIAKIARNIVQSKRLLPWLKIINPTLTAEREQYGNEDAALQYQTLGKEAQDALKIENQVSVKNSAILLDGTAQALSHTIYINENTLDAYPYGFKRCVLFHEAAHIKHHDNVFLSALRKVGKWASITASIASIAIYKYNKNPNIKSLLLAGGATWLASQLIFGISGGIYMQHMEHRADVDGHRATQCFACMQESALIDFFENGTHSKKPNIYLNAYEKEQIAKEFFDQHKVYAHHTSQNATWILTEDFKQSIIASGQALSQAKNRDDIRKILQTIPKVPYGSKEAIFSPK